MNEIKCPTCNTAFTIDEANYDSIARQIRDDVFERDLQTRLAHAEREAASALAIAEARAATAMQTALTHKEVEITGLKAMLDGAAVAKEVAVRDSESRQAAAITELQASLRVKDAEHALREKAMRERYETQLKDRDDSIERLRDMKSKLSTKMLGETLEQHCEVAFEKVRAGAFQTATFGKDNDASSGSKGDYIFRDRDANGVEFVSIMFEMKNEADATASKKRNFDFLKELDKDRAEKGCEYAILVSALEPESELYNEGIVDVSHLYPKMYVIRPQFFVPMITLLRNAAQASVHVRGELARIQEQNVDITDFESRLLKFKGDVSRNYGLATGHFDEGVKRIDEAIKDLEKAKDALIRSGNQWRLVNDKVDGITIRQLTRGNPTMAARFAELERGEELSA
ncbi:DUF2130 domain-containing protein [Pseudolysinimonas sp.]